MEENKNLEPVNENLSDDEILDFGSEYAEVEFTLNEEDSENNATCEDTEISEIKDEKVSEETSDEIPEEDKKAQAFQEPAECAKPPYTPPYQPPQQNYTRPPYQPPQQPRQTPPYAPPYQPPYGAPQNFAPQPPAPPKKSAGAKVMLICLWVLLGLFGLTIIGVCGYYMGQKNFSSQLRPDYKNDRYDSYTSPYSPDDDDDKATDPYSDTKPNVYPDDSPLRPDNNNDEDETPDNSELFDQNTKITLNTYPADKSDRNKYTTQYAYEKISPSTVGIMCYSKEISNRLESQGTGIIITTNGYIATNSHVIGDKKFGYTIKVILEDGNTYTAAVVGYDTRTDLAVLKIEATGLTPAEFADSELISIGEDVIAVGNPGGMEFQNTLTRGVVSAKDRTLDLSTQVKYIQTDAAINPGNSGGPLCNACGQVVGINSAKIADEHYEGMGFSIPSQTVKEVVDDLIMQGYVSDRVQVGIIGTAVSEYEAQRYKVPRGILISEVVEDGPCDNGKVKVNDILCKLDDYEIKSFNDIYSALANYKEGDEVTLKFYRQSIEDYVEVVVTLEADNGSYEE